jgi:hypothetical protein
MRLLVDGSAVLQKAKPYPYLRRPFQYFAAFIALMNALKWLNVPWLRDLPDWTALEYNAGLVAVALLMPFAAIIATVALVISVGALNFFVGTIANLLGRPQRNANLGINWAFFTMLCQRRFWRNYRYGDLMPALLYCSINATLLWPIAYYIFTSIVSALDAFSRWELIDDLMGQNANIWRVSLSALIALAAIFTVYGLILRPMLYAFLFRSQAPLLRQGVYPELLRFHRHLITSPGPVVYLGADLEPTSPEHAAFLWLHRILPGGHVLNRLSAAPK